MVDADWLAAAPAPETVEGGAGQWYSALLALAAGRPLFVLNLRDEPDPEVEGIRARFLHVPVPDFGVPSRDDAARALAFLDVAAAARGLAVIHCRAGCGRTGTVLALYLRHRYGISGDEALARLRGVDPCFVETAEQESFVRTF
jgi:protein-tyrosine phosphatase